MSDGKAQQASGGKKKELSQGNWLPLESNPSVLTQFASRVGLPSDWTFTDVWGTDKALLDFLPKPCAGIVLLFSSTAEIAKFKADQKAAVESKGQDVSKDLFYVTQHDGIGNACGTIACIHCLANSNKLYEATGPVKKFMDDMKGKNASQKGYGLLEAKAIQEVSEEAAESEESQTATPERTENVGAHFIAFIICDGSLYEMDGRKAFPINHGKTTQESFIYDAAKVIKTNFFDVSPKGKFSMMALVKKPKN